MKGILVSWLNECLDLNITADNIGEYLKDGVALARLLKHYNVVNRQVIKRILPSDNSETCRNNLHQLCVWFNLLGIKVTNETVNSIADKKTTATLQLLYELYSKLNDKKQLQSLITEQKTSFKFGSLKNKYLCKFLREYHKKISHHEHEVKVKGSCQNTKEGAEEEDEEEEDVDEQRKRIEKSCVETQQKQLTPPAQNKMKTLYERIRQEDIYFVRNILNTPNYLTTDTKKRASPAYHALLQEVHRLDEELNEEQELEQECKETNVEIPDTWTGSFKYSEGLIPVTDTERTERQMSKTVSQNISQQSDHEKHLSVEKFQAKSFDKTNTEQFTQRTQAMVDGSTDYSNFVSICKTSEEEIAYQMEEINKMELHRRLYNEKIKRRNKRHLLLCQEFVRDIIDLAIKVVDYGKECVTKELIAGWKQMLIMGVPLLEPTEEITDIDVVEMESEEPTIQECNFDDYNHLVGDWFSIAGVDVSYDDQLVLGYIVNRLQNCKLPPVISIVAAAIPRYKTTAVLNCTFDELTIIKLKTLLAKSKICITDIQSAVQFCIDQYKVEANIKPPEPLDTKNKKPSKSKGGTAETAKTNSKGAKGKHKSPTLAIAYKDEEVQTGTSLLDNVVKPIHLSDAALVGRRLYESPTPYDLPTDTLTEVLVEFLKCQSDIEGWVLINFPSNLHEAYQVEKNLLGQDFPQVFGLTEKEPRTSNVSEQSYKQNDDFPEVFGPMEKEFRTSNESKQSHKPNNDFPEGFEPTEKEFRTSNVSKQSYKQNDDFPEVFGAMEKEFRASNESKQSHKPNDESYMKRSRLVHMPNQPKEVFKTYFTSIINVLKRGPVTNPGNTNEHEEMMEEGEEKRDVAVTFTSVYTDQGILQNFYYETLDFAALKDLAHVILQTETYIERIPSNELFGEEVIQYYNKPTETMGTTPKTPKKPPSKKMVKGNDDLSTAKAFLDKVILSFKPAPEELNLEPVDNNSKLYQLTEKAEREVPSLIPGQFGWAFAQFPLVEDDGIALADLWSEIEDTYITKVEDALYINEQNRSLIWHYINFITKTLTQAQLPDADGNTDSRTITVDNFVQYLNNILLCHKLNSDTMEKVSNAIFNIEMELWKSSKERRNRTESEKRQLIGHNWTAEEMIEVVKGHALIIEAEVERANSTLHMLYNYYSSMCGRIPFVEDIPQLEVLNFDTFSCEQICELNHTMARILTDKTEMNLSDPITIMIPKVAVQYTTAINLLKAKFEDVIDNYRSQVLHKISEFNYRSASVSSTTEPVANENQISEEIIEEVEEDKNQKIDLSPLAEAKDNTITNMFLEWRNAVKSELDRLCWRIRIVTGKTTDALDNLVDNVTNVFYKFHDEITSNYLSENDCIDKLCVLFRSAILNKTPVTGQVVCENNCIFIENTISDDPNLPSIDFTFEENFKDCCFTINQLEKIMDKLKTAAPDGIINRRALRYIVEDMIYHEFTDDEFQLFPKFWTNLESFELKQVWKTAFGSSSKMHWRNFLLYCLDMPFPEVQDMVEYKEMFTSFDKENTGTISYQDYTSINLWFQEDADNIVQDAHYKSIKEFLFNMFKVEEDKMDYNNFFLLLAKGHTPTAGFGKALSYLTGRCTIVYEQAAYLEEIMTEYNDLLNKMVKEILEEKINEVFKDLYGLKIEEVEDESAVERQVGSTSVSTRSMQQSELIKKTAESEYNEVETGGENEENYEDEEECTTDNRSQTISLTELMYNRYISKNKQYQWTTKISPDVVNTLLETLVYPILDFQEEFFSAQMIRQNIKDTLCRLEEDGLISLISLMKENDFHLLFMYTRTFQIISLPSMAKDFIETCLS